MARSASVLLALLVPALAGCLHGAAPPAAPAPAPAIAVPPPSVEWRSCSFLDAFSYAGNGAEAAKLLPPGYRTGDGLTNYEVQVLSCDVVVGNVTIPGVRLALTAVLLTAADGNEVSAGYDAYLLELFVDPATAGAFAGYLNATGTAWIPAAIHLDAASATITSAQASYRVSVGPSGQAAVGAGGGTTRQHHKGADGVGRWLDLQVGNLAGPVQASLVEVHGGLLQTVVPSAAGSPGLGYALAADFTVTPGNATVFKAPPEIADAIAGETTPDIHLSKCFAAQEYFWQVDAASVQPLLPPGFVAATTTADVFFTLGARPEVAARSELVAYTCDVFVGQEAYRGIRLAWSGVLLNKAGGHETADFPARDQFTFEFFVDGDAPAAVDLWQRHGWNVTRAHIDLEQDALSIRQGAHLIYQARRGPDLATGGAGDNSERRHVLGPDGATHYVNLGGAIFHYTGPPNTSLLETHDGILGQFTVAGQRPATYAGNQVAISARHLTLTFDS